MFLKFCLTPIRLLLLETTLPTEISLYCQPRPTVPTSRPRVRETGPKLYPKRGKASRCNPYCMACKADSHSQVPKRTRRIIVLARYPRPLSQDVRLGETGSALQRGTPTQCYSLFRHEVSRRLGCLRISSDPPSLNPLPRVRAPLWLFD